MTGWPNAGPIRRWLPQGIPLPDAVWRPRHQTMRVVLWAHVPVLFVLALMVGNSVGHSTAELVPLVAAGAVAQCARKRRTAAVLTAVGLLSCSAVLVHISDGVIEMHFHYFVMVALITLYHDWWPILIAIGYVVFQHGIGAALDPSSVFNHTAGQHYPWPWVLLHGGFIVALSVVGIASWRLNERFLEDVDKGRARLAEAQAVARIGSWDTDFTTGRVSWSDEMYRLLDVDPAVVEPSPATFLEAVHPEDRAMVERASQSVRTSATPVSIQFRIVVGADERWVQLRTSATTVDGTVVAIAGTAQDITDQKRLEHELAHRAFHDPLTNLANQALFRDRVEHALTGVSARRSGIAVLFVDLDNFKRVNDGLGHLAGDELLVVVARRLRDCIRATDTAARLGGDEFAILLEDVDGLPFAEEVAGRVVSAVQEPFTYGERVVHISASVGVIVPDADTSVDQLLSEADLAMYTAKQRGKARYETYVADFHAAVMDRLELEVDLRRGVERGEIVVHYQPIITLDTYTVSGVEALVRWNHPTRGLLMPGEFVPIAEESALIVEMGRQVLHVACQQVAGWNDRRPGEAPLEISVNIASRQIQDGSIVNDVREALERSGLEPTSLVLEITETAMMTDPDLAIHVLEQLKRLGVKLAVDDFGVGYSSLNYLQRFPVDVLKIDRTFISALTGDKPDLASLTATIVALARSLELYSVAEGVETAMQAALVADLGCDAAQGFLYSRPMDATRIGDQLGLRSDTIVASG